MELLWKGFGISLLCCVLCVVIGKQGKDFSLLLSLAGSAAVMAIVIFYLKPVLSFIRELETTAGLHSDYLAVIIKAVAVGMASEIVAVICSDSGNQGLGKSVQIMGSAVILWLSLPLFTELLELIGILLEDI